MNRRQKVVVLIGVAVVALMLLVPPWKYVRLMKGDNVERDAGYALIFSPPSLKNHASIMEAYSIPKTRTVQPYSPVSIANTTLWGNVNGKYGPIYTPTPTPEPPRVESNVISESEFQVRMDTARLAVQCGVVAAVTLGLFVFGHKKD